MALQNYLSASLPSIDELRCFVAAAHTLHFRAAARAVALTPAALGQRIRQLEDRLGKPLFTRTTRSVALSEAGLVLLPVAERCLESAGDCERVVRGDLVRSEVDVILGTRYELGLSWVVPQIGPLRKKLPWLRLHLYFGSGQDLLSRVRGGEIDCAVTSTRLSDPRLHSFPLHEERYVFCASARLLREKPLRKSEDAVKHVLLDTSPDLPLFRYFREASGGASLEFGETLSLGSIGAIKQELLRGAGVAVLPEYWMQTEFRSKKAVRLFPNVELGADHFRLICRTVDPRRSVFEELAKEMRQTPLR